jgi:hypothetical protein
MCLLSLEDDLLGQTASEEDGHSVGRGSGKVLGDEPDDEVRDARELSEMRVSGEMEKKSIRLPLLCNNAPPFHKSLLYLAPLR